MLAGALLHEISSPAGASARKRCRHKGGVYFSAGQCHCAFKCPSESIFPCHGTEECVCGETIEGKSFCAGLPTGTGSCTSSAARGEGFRCVLEGCSATACPTGTECAADEVCRRGPCQQGFCHAPCAV